MIFKPLGFTFSRTSPFIVTGKLCRTSGWAEVGSRARVLLGCFKSVATLSQAPEQKLLIGKPGFCHRTIFGDGKLACFDKKKKKERKLTIGRYQHTPSHDMMHVRRGSEEI